MDARNNQDEIAPRLFDLANRDHIKELKAWCKFNFIHIVTKALQNSNSTIFHDCCLSFCKRGCLKRLSHPPLQSVSILRIPSLRNATCPEELFEWLKARMIQHCHLGQPIYFPSINIAHFSSQQDSLESAEFLGKRVERLTEELLKTELEVGKMKDENSRLLNSTKLWHDKYQQLLHRLEEDKASYTEITPKKLFTTKETLTNETFLDL